MERWFHAATETDRANGPGALISAGYVMLPSCWAGPRRARRRCGVDRLSGAMRLLLVEDSRRLQRTLTEGLSRARHTVDVACDGAEGLRMAQAAKYDAVILDLMLPERDGLSV